MRWAGALQNIVQTHLIDVVLGLSVLVLILLVSVIVLNVKLGKMSRRKSKVKLPQDVNLLDMLHKGLEEVQGYSEVVDALGQSHKSLVMQQKLDIQRIGLVKFNAFDDIGGEQSFALALLDAENNGVLLSSLLSRTESRTYAKAISAGTSEQVLSLEEQQALSRAMKV